MTQMEENLPVIWKTQIRSPGWQDLEKGMATRTSILACSIPGTDDPVHGVTKSQT